LTGPNSLQYQVSQNGTYSAGQNVPITSVDQGSQTNLAVGTIMTWSAPQANMQSTCLVSVAVAGGADAEDDNTLRNRLYLTLQSPPQAGNSQQLTTIAGQTDGEVQQAFVYSNFNGAGTQLIALTGYQTFSYIGRDIPHLPTDGYVAPYGVSQLSPGLDAQTELFPSSSNTINNGYAYGPYNQWSLGTDNIGVATGLVGQGNPGSNLSSDTSILYGQLPGTVANSYATVVTTVNNYPSDIAAVLTLPYPVGSVNNGYGNGWMDSNPWPIPDGYYVSDGYCKVVAVISSTQITISAPSGGGTHTSPPFGVSSLTFTNHTPTPGATHIQWVNRSDYLGTGWTVITATVIAATDNGNDTWTITLDTPLVYPPNTVDFYNVAGVDTGQFIFPACINAQNYVNNIMQQYALLGPGQCTSSQGLLVLGASRYPSSNAQFPNTIGVQLERALVSNNNEVYAASVNSAAWYVNEGTATNPNWQQANTGYYGNGNANIAGAVNTAFYAPYPSAPPFIYCPRNIAFYCVESYGFCT
jgi:hypothetical protein